MNRPISYYNSLIKNRILEHDNSQENLVRSLDKLYLEIKYFQESQKNLIKKVFSSNNKTPLGLYIFGDVGRGKSMLMDMFCNTNGIEKIKRFHFHAFMQDTHIKIREQRNKSKAGDPISYVAKSIFSEINVLCFDEFQVNDAADAMILKRLFQKLFEMGLIIITTSNQHPDDLYKGGINRELFLPFIDLLKEKCNIFQIEGGRDFRLEKLITNKVYFFPINPTNKSAFHTLFEEISGNKNAGITQINLQSRVIDIEKYSNGIGLMSFDNLCNKPLGTQEYIAIAKNFKTFFISDIPIIDNQQINQIKRFINLIDVLYDNNIRVVFLASERPEKLYKEGSFLSEFKRTSSRLYEMQSESYLKKIHS